MEDKLRRYIEGLFKDVPPTKNVVELKEEMIQNLIEKYEDLIHEGKSEEAAFNIAVSGIGDINELLDDMDKEKKAVTNNNDRQKAAMLTSIAVMLYILSIVPILITMNSSFGFFNGIIGFFVLVTVATGIMIYNSMTKPKYIRKEDTMVAEFKEWQTKKSSKRMARASVSVALWSIVLALYFIISFETMEWQLTWVIFIAAIAVEAFINIFTSLRK